MRSNLTHALRAGPVLAMLLVSSEASGDWVIRPFVGATMQSSHGFVDLEQSARDSKIFAGAAVGWHPTALGFEMEFAVSPAFLGGNQDLVVASRLTSIMGNVTWQLPRPTASARLRTYIAGGAGVIRVSVEDALDAFSSQSSLWSGNVGGGVLIRVRRRLDVNADVRYFRSQFGNPNSAGFGEQFVDFTRISGGAVVRF
jgi:hypothetical protein